MASLECSEAKTESSVLDRAVWIVVAGATVVSIAMGVRQSFGLFVGPFSSEHGIPITTFALAVAIQNLVWGLAQPIAGAVADRRGAVGVIAAGGFFFSAGVGLTALGGNAAAALIGTGVLVGLGLSCTTFAVVLGVVGRAVDPAKRGMALSLASAGGSLGQVGIVPMAQRMIDSAGVETALLTLCAIAFAMAPLALAFVKAEKPVLAPRAEPEQSIVQAIVEAAGHSGFLFLTAGFFVCGFQLAFISTHLPGYLETCALPASLGAVALAVIGLFNILGTWACGALAGRVPYKTILAVLYAVRGVAITAFLFAPKTDVSVIAFAVAMGVTWLATVPMTSGLIAQIFAPRYLGTLFGLCFLNHQVGSFFGSWMGGWVFEATGSYDLIWVLTAGAGFVATALHLPINDRALRTA